MYHSLFKAIPLVLCCSSWAMNPIITQEEIDEANNALSALSGSTKFFKAIELSKEITQSHYKNTNGTDWQFIRSDYQARVELSPQQQRAEMKEREDFLNMTHKAHDLFSDIRIILLNTHNFPMPVVQYSEDKYEKFMGLQSAAIKQAIKTVEQNEVKRANKAILEATAECADDIDRITNKYRRICAHLLVWAFVGWGAAAYESYLKPFIFETYFKR